MGRRRGLAHRCRAVRRVLRLERREVGKNPMRDWRAAAEGWCRRDGLKRRGEAKRKVCATCPKCGARMFKNTQSGRWDCPKCFESFDKGAVA